MSSPPSSDTAAVPAWLPLAAVGVTLVLWASAFVGIRHLAGTFSPGALSLGRLAFGAVALGVALLVSRSWRAPTRREWLGMTAVGVLWFGIYNVALNAAKLGGDALLSDHGNLHRRFFWLNTAINTVFENCLL